jgi:phage baseplate assembly protein W
MAYTILNTSQTSKITTDKVLGVSLNFNVPGVFERVYTSDKQALENLKNLLLTTPGERIENVTFGCALMNIIFEQSTDQTKGQLENIISDAVSYWLPYIDIDEIDIVTAADNPDSNHLISIKIVFFVTGTIETQTLSIQISEEGVVNIG